MNRREMIRLALVLSTVSCARPFSRDVWAQILPEGGPSRIPFSDDTRRMVEVICDLIIPATDTPGAVDAGVPQFIELMVSDWYTDTERRVFFEGLEALNAHCGKNFGRSFAACDAQQQTAALRDAERQALEYSATHAEPTSPYYYLDVTDEKAPLFSKMKELTVLGYYTSEVGATQELSYHPVPGRYEGTYPFSKAGKQWSF